MKRPSAIFFLPEPPRNVGIPAQLRSEPAGGRALGPGELREIRATRRLQGLLSAWFRSSDRGPVLFPAIDRGSDPEDSGALLREFIGIGVDLQRNWTGVRDAFQHWRSALAERRVQVVQLQLGPGGVRGFSSWDDYLPVVAINTNYNVAARIYTVFHELAHLAARSDAACSDVLPNQAPRLERWCEQTAAAALLPADDVQAVVAEAGDLVADGLALSSRIADEFSVSLRAAAIRLLDLSIIERRGTLVALLRDSGSTWDRDKGFARGRPSDRIDRRVRQWGGSLLNHFEQAMEASFVGERELRDYLGLTSAEFQEARAPLVADE